ncbi:MAG: glycosyl hydrolase [Bacilli bacterium]|nr:glycosyl hydrolase [Bacilli bacterium]
MLPRLEQSSNHRPIRRRFIILPVIFLLLIIAAALYVGWVKYWPNSLHVKPDFHGLDKPLFYRGELMELPAMGDQETLKLPFDVVSKFIDPTLLYEKNSDSVIITTQDKVIRLKTNQLTGLINEKPFTLRFPVEKAGDNVYLPIEPLRKYYQIDLRESEDTGAVLLMKEGDTVQWGKLISEQNHPKDQYALRSKPTIKAPIYADLKQAEAVMIWGEDNGWYRVQLANGTMGYVQKTQVVLDHIEMIPKQAEKQDFVAWKPLGGKINLTWQQVNKKTPDTAAIKAMPGLNVISPQWFHLIDGKGSLQNLADAAYVKWAHAQGLQLWALFGNATEQKQTTEALSTYDTRMNMIKQLVSFAQLYHLEGINIDFENVALRDKANMVQFVREMTPFLHEQGLVVSIDVTVKDGSDSYSKFMDRQAIAEVVDYMIVMTYDEHWAADQTSGSVASLPWVEKGIKQIMSEDAVPASKIVLGVPFFTRIWTEQNKDNKTVVTSKAVSMDAVLKIIKDKKLTQTFDAASGQNYVEYTEGDKKMRIWIEDAMSMQSRMDILKRLDLAGVGSWSRSLETPDIWTTIKNALEKKP